GDAALLVTRGPAYRFELHVNFAVVAFSAHIRTSQAGGETSLPSKYFAKILSGHAWADRLHLFENGTEPLLVAVLTGLRLARLCDVRTRMAKSNEEKDDKQLEDSVHVR